MSKKESDEIKAFSAVIVAMLAIPWAPILTVFSQADPAVIAFWRLTFASIIMSFLGFVFNKSEQIPEFQKVFRRDNLLLMVLSGFFLAIHFWSWNASLFLTGIAKSTMIVDSAPLFVILGSIVFFKEEFSMKQLGWMFLAFLGIIIISFPDWSWNENVSAALVGDLLALIGAITVAGYILIGRFIRQDIDVFVYTSVVYGIASIFLLIVIILSFSSTMILSALILLSWQEYLIFLSLAIVASVLGHSLYNYALKTYSGPLISISFYSEAIGATILSYFFFNKSPELLFFPGAAIIIIAMYFALKEEKSNQQLI